MLGSQRSLSTVAGQVSATALSWRGAKEGCVEVGVQLVKGHSNAYLDI